MMDDLADIFSNIEFIAFDFDGVFTDNLVHTTETGEESVSCWRGDGLGLANIKKIGIPIWVISTEKNPVVARRCHKLGIDYIQGCEDKLAALKKLLNKYRCNIKNTIFTGNDINDAECLKEVGVPIIVADSHIDIHNLARYITEKDGGKGAVREICDLIVKHYVPYSQKGEK